LKEVVLDEEVVGMLAWKGRRYRPGQRISEREFYPVVLELTEARDYVMQLIERGGEK
jgi:hypothetical protein